VDLGTALNQKFSVEIREVVRVACCSVLQCVAVCSSVLQRVAAMLSGHWHCVESEVYCRDQEDCVCCVLQQCCRVLQECCSVLRCVAVCCSVDSEVYFRDKGGCVCCMLQE